MQGCVGSWNPAQLQRGSTPRSFTPSGSPSDQGGGVLIRTLDESIIQPTGAQAGQSHLRTAFHMSPERRRRLRQSRNEEIVSTGDYRQPYRELQLARELQFEMFPASHPPEAKWDRAARSSGAQTVGGDFYDFFRYPGKAISAEAIGDAGASAAIYAALVAGILRSLAPLELGPAEMLRALNKALLKLPVRARDVSMIYATWDERDRDFYIANAGLPYPICVQKGKACSLEASGLPLGLSESAEYEEHTVECGAADQVVFYTDGVTEAADKHIEEFRSESLER